MIGFAGFRWIFASEPSGARGDAAPSSMPVDEAGHGEPNEGSNGATASSPRSDEERSDPASKVTGPRADGKFLPHPESTERSTMLARRALFERAKLAARSGDVAALRKILREQSQTAGGDAFADWSEAYELILECLEQGDAPSRKRAERFVDEQRGSTLRRDVRRYCRL